MQKWRNGELFVGENPSIDWKVDFLRRRFIEQEEVWASMLYTNGLSGSKQSPEVGWVKPKRIGLKT